MWTWLSLLTAMQSIGTYMMLIRKEQGPLFCKHFTDYLTTSNKHTKISLLGLIKGYKVNMVNSEDIQKIYFQLLSIAETLYLLDNNILPVDVDVLNNYIIIYTTTSCTDFNDLFINLKKQRSLSIGIILSYLN